MRINDHNGYSLIELIVVIVIFGIIATVAVRSLRESTDVTRTLDTREKLDRLAWAIAGDPAVTSGGARTDFGYVGDVGALPPSLDALVTNPGLASWNGPYIRDDFFAGGAESAFKRDAWNNEFLYTGGVTITAGGAAGLTREIAATGTALLGNEVRVSIADIDHSPPGAAFADSVSIELIYPDGAGGYATAQRTPAADGFAQFSGVPIGVHTLQVIYLPTADTLTRKVTIMPGHDYVAELNYFANVWGGSGS